MKHVFFISDFFNEFFNESSFSSTFNNSSFGFEAPKDDDKNFNKVEEVKENENFKIKKETWTSVDGNITFTRTSTESKKAPEVQKNIDKKKLEKLMANAVAAQNFEEAAKLRDELKKLNA